MNLKGSYNTKTSPISIFLFNPICPHPQGPINISRFFNKVQAIFLQTCHNDIRNEMFQFSICLLPLHNAFFGRSKIMTIIRYRQIFSGGGGEYRTKMKTWSENFSRASGAQKRGSQIFCLRRAFSLWRH